MKHEKAVRADLRLRLGFKPWRPIGRHAQEPVVGVLVRQQDVSCQPSVSGGDDREWFVSIQTPAKSKTRGVCAYYPATELVEVAEAFRHDPQGGYDRVAGTAHAQGLVG